MKFLVLRLIHSESLETPKEFKVNFAGETPSIGSILGMIAPNGFHFADVVVKEHRHEIQCHQQPDATTTEISIVCEVIIGHEKSYSYFHTWLEESGFFILDCH